MSSRERVFIWTIALLIGLAGGVASRWIPSLWFAKVQQIVAANEFLVTDKNSSRYAVLGIEDGEPALKFYGPDKKLRGYLGFEGDEPRLELERSNGSSAWLCPNDDGPGWHLALLKSLGEGKGVYMSMMTADDFTIYQSKVGGLELGNIDGKMAINIHDADGKLTWTTDPQQRFSAVNRKH